MELEVGSDGDSIDIGAEQVNHFVWIDAITETLL